MVMIRLSRVGSIHQPSYRVVVTDKRAPVQGRFIEIIGNFNPRTEPETVAIDAERAPGIGAARAIEGANLGARRLDKPFGNRTGKEGAHKIAVRTQRAERVA